MQKQRKGVAHRNTQSPDFSREMYEERLKVRPYLEEGRINSLPNPKTAVQQRLRDRAIILEYADLTASLLNRVDECEEQTSKIKEEWDDYKSEQTCHDEEIAARDDEIAKLERINRKLEKDIDDLTNELNQQDRKIAQLENEITTLTFANNRLSREAIHG